MLNNFFKYLNITSFEHRWGNYVTTVGYSKVNPNDQYPNEQHPKSHDLTWNRGRILNDYYIVYISRGKGIYKSGLTEPTKVVAGNCFFLFPGVRHGYKPDPKLGWEEFWVGFNGIQIQHLMNEGIFNTSKPIIDLGYDTEILTLFNKLIETVGASLAGYPQQISGITMQILGLINTKAKYNIQTNNPDEKLIAKAKYIMQESFENNINMEVLSEELPLGYSSFRKKFKQITGLSPNQYLINLRLERAKYLLVMTNLNVSEISHQIGFDNIFYFSKLFKKKYDISPKNYRLMHIG
ncbi:AraC family transcriptional regulator [Arenibacter algicola]|uniref:AraC family transcriptional regulator n=1 Tax=Arenibacter algicola TaxID=616991 RepID=UPI001C076112|nr:AraC family transcriptional regulator [Arenibacter algicola]MBU2906698.1 AraC family transcriptional regulator [Arenibacter algicola]